MKSAEEILKSKCKQLDTSKSFWGNQKVTAAQAIGAMKEYASQNTLNRDKVMEVLKQFAVSPIGGHTEEYQNQIADAICSLSVPDAQQPSESEKKAIKNFTDKLANQEDIPLDIIDIVNENFWDLLPDKHPKDKPTLSEREIEHEAQLTGEIETFKNKYVEDEFKAFKNGYICAIREHVFGEERVYPNQLTKPKEER